MAKTIKKNVKERLLFLLLLLEHIVVPCKTTSVTASGVTKVTTALSMYLQRAFVEPHFRGSVYTIRLR